MKLSLGLQKIPSHYIVAVSGWLSRLVVGASQIYSVSIVLGYLGVRLYAVFAIILGLQGWFLLADYGLGASLQNYISEARANNKDIKFLLINSAAIIMGLLLVTSVVFILLSPIIQYYLLRKIAPELASSQYHTVLSIGLICIATTLFGVAYRVLFAIHKGYWVYFYQGIGSIISVAAILFIKYLNINDNRLFIIFLGWLLPPLMISLLSYSQIFIQKTMLKYLDIKLIKQLLVRGFKFWSFAVANALTVYIDYIVMAQTLGETDITIYNILSKGFGVIFFAYDALLTASWPILSELFIKKRWNSIEQVLNKNIYIGIFFVIIFTATFVFARSFVMSILASGKNIQLPIATIILFGIYAMIRIHTYAYSMALQSQNCIKVFWVCVPIQATLNAIGMFFFSSRIGVNGILLGLIMSFILTASWALPFTYYKRKKLCETLA